MSDKAQHAGGWPDPQRPGVPMHPERDGWHWVQWPNGGAPHPERWGQTPGGWFGWPEWRNGYMASRYTYLGPCLTPSEVAEREAAAWIVGRDAALDAVASPTAVDWAKDETVRVLADACKRANTLTPPASLSDALTAREAAARREGIEAARPLLAAADEVLAGLARGECEQHMHGQLAPVVGAFRALRARTGEGE